MRSSISFDLSRFERTVDEVFTLEELRAKLALNRPLRIKYGVDVTAPFLHIGHAVNLWMMRELQEAGHIVIFLIGDFTTQIGDPTGKSQTRRTINQEEIEPNAQEFIKQVGKILLTEPEVFEVRRNSEWYKVMDLREFMSLLSMVTHSKLIQRDMFQRRIESKQEVYTHELIYPILQGYDSVMLESDLTIVGTDQLFNELMGRFYQEKFKQSPQVVMTTKITPGTDGVEKQSKSLGNYIALSDTARDKFGKIMSLPDSLVVQYLKVYTTIPIDEIQSLERAVGQGIMNPMEAKKRLAAALVERYHDRETAQIEHEWFNETFSQRKTPSDIPEVRVSATQTLIEILLACAPTTSKAEFRRLLGQGAVRLNDAKVTQAEFVGVKSGDILKIGKRQWFRLLRD